MCCVVREWTGSGARGEEKTDSLPSHTCIRRVWNLIPKLRFFFWSWVLLARSEIKTRKSLIITSGLSSANILPFSQPLPPVSSRVLLGHRRSPPSLLASHQRPPPPLGPLRIYSQAIFLEACCPLLILKWKICFRSHMRWQGREEWVRASQIGTGVSDSLPVICKPIMRNALDHG